MGKPHPMKLRERIAALVGERSGLCEAARHFRTSSHFVNCLILKFDGAIFPQG